jgi:hypothetical protein
MCVAFKDTKDLKPQMRHFQGHKSKRWIYKRVIIDKKIYAFNKNEMQGTNDIHKCKRCPRGGGIASFGQILNIGDKQNHQYKETFNHLRNIRGWHNGNPSSIFKPSLFKSCERINLLVQFLFYF